MIHFNLTLIRQTATLALLAFWATAFGVIYITDPPCVDKRVDLVNVLSWIVTISVVAALNIADRPSKD